MKRLLLLTTLTYACMTFSVHASSYESGDLVCTGRVIYVSDGDTVHVKCNGQKLKIRVAEIDSPEIEKQNKPCFGQPLGKGAKQLANEILLGRTVDVRFFDEDRWKRMVARLFVDGRNYSHLLIEAGFAHIYERYAKDDRLKISLTKAKVGRNGLWSLPPKCIMNPAKWRSQLTNNQRCALQDEWFQQGCYR